MASRIKRAVKALGHGAANTAKAAVFGLKVISKRQLTKKRLATANGKTVGFGKLSGATVTTDFSREGSHIKISVQHDSVSDPRKAPNWNRVERTYDSKGRLVKKVSQGLGNNTRETVYHPAGRFIGKRIRPKK